MRRGDLVTTDGDFFLRAACMFRHHRQQAAEGNIRRTGQRNIRRESAHRYHLVHRVGRDVNDLAVIRRRHLRRQPRHHRIEHDNHIGIFDIRVRIISGMHRVARRHCDVTIAIFDHRDGICLRQFNQRRHHTGVPSAPVRDHHRSFSICQKRRDLVERVWIRIWR